MAHQDDIVLTQLRGHVYSLPEPERKQVEDAAARIRAIVAESPDCGNIAVALVGAEMAAKD